MDAVELEKEMRKLNVEDGLGYVGSEPAGDVDGSEHTRIHDNNLVSPYEKAKPPELGPTTQRTPSDFSETHYPGKFSSRLGGETFVVNGGTVEVSENDLGDGGQGYVYAGTMFVLNRTSLKVVVKDFSKLSAAKGQQALNSEIDAYGRVGEHENIANFLSPCIDEGKNVGIVLERMPRNLHDAIDDGLIKTYGIVVTVLLGIAKGLSHLYDKNVVHFDLKPSNVLLTDDLIPKIVDFGSSKVRFNESITATRRGTLQYMAPELLLHYYDTQQGHKQAGDNGDRVNKLIDVFSFGKLAIHMIVGYKTFFNDADVQMDRVKALIEEGKYVEVGGVFQQKFPCDCPAELRELINKCLRYDPDDLEAAATGFGRPRPSDIVEELESMLNSEWIDEKVEYK